MGVILTFLLFLGWGQAVYAATIAVNTTEDELNSDGDCSLREAIQAANTDAAVDACTAGSGADTIVLPAGTYTLSIAGADEDANASGDLDINSDLTINGAGPSTTIIDGASLDRVFHIVGGTVEITGLTIQNGSFGAAPGGGGILNQGTLTLTHATVSGNTAVVFGPPAGGGGIYNQGTLNLNSSTVSSNVASNGGGILNQGMLTLTDTTISGNTALGSGGGIMNIFPGIVTITDSTISGNTGAPGGACGIAVGGGMCMGSGSLTNVTISGNSAGDGWGGGIAFGGGLTLTNVTISDNSAGLGGGIFGTDPGSAPAGPTLKNTIVANNTGSDCSNRIVSAGHNLIENTTNCVIDGDTTGNIIGVDPLLGPLAHNGGPTQTHALLAGSPAIDAGSSDCPPPATDQRGEPRPSGTACDIGAYEFQQTLQVQIDIKPGSDPNCFNNDGKGVISVAILGSATLDVTQVDAGSVKLESLPVKAVGKSNKLLAHIENVNNDSFNDLVVQIEDVDGVFSPGTTTATLTGNLLPALGSTPIKGSDSICITQ